MDGKPCPNKRVGVFVYQFAASGMKDSVYTDANGEACINLDTDDFAEISIYIDGDEKVKRGNIRGEYHITA